MKTFVRAWLAVLLLGGIGTVAAQRTDEATLQAAYVINFVRYSQWPASAADAPFVIAVVGSASAGDALETVAQRVGTVEGRPIVIRPVPVGPVAPRREVGVPAMRDALADAQVVFVAETHAGWHDAVVDATEGHAVLTVSAGRGFVAAGGMFELFETEGHVYFTANEPVLARAVVRVSARVMGLSRARPVES